MREKKFIEIKTSLSYGTICYIIEVLETKAEQQTILVNKVVTMLYNFLDGETPYYCVQLYWRFAN